MTDTPPRDDPQCEHDWQPDDSGSVSVTGATNIRRCTRCVAFTWIQAAGTAIRTTTELHWGEGVTSDATRTGREVGIPVCDDDGRELGEMRMGYANAGVLGAMLTDAARDANPVHGWVKAQLGDLPEWQKRWLDQLMQMRSRERRRAGHEANSAYQRSMRLAQGHDVPPLPAPALPTRVDDLDSDTYDALRSRYAWLEQRHRETAHSEQGALLAKQAKEIGDLRAGVDRVREIHRPMKCVNVRCAEKQWCIGCDPNGYGGCSESPWPCPTIRAFDGSQDAPTNTPSDMPLTCGDCGYPVTHANYRCGTCGCPNGSVDLTITPTSTALDDTPEQP